MSCDHLVILNTYSDVIIMTLSPVLQHVLLFFSILSYEELHSGFISDVIIMRLSPVSQNLLFISVLSLSITTTSTWTAPAIFYPFGSAAGDTIHLVNFDEIYSYVAFSTPFKFFGRTYNHTYVNNNGLLTFNQALPEAQPYYFPTFGSRDFIAPLWTDLDDFGLGSFSYQQYTSVNVLTRATQDINQYFPQMNFSASWVFVATWDFVKTGDSNAITFQVVLISGNGYYFILMNYGDCTVINDHVEAGYDTVNSIDYYRIHHSTSGSYLPNLKNTTNINVPGRWAFAVNDRPAPEIFYPFGSAAGDTRSAFADDGSSSLIQLSSPFLFFGRTYRQIYVNNNGHLTFNQPSSAFTPYSFPTNGNQDIIAGLWTNLDNSVRGFVSYQQYTSGNVLTRTTQDINTYFPNLNFSASWVFVATWNKVAYFNLANLEASFQVVLISGSNYSFILMNYGDIAVTGNPVQAGYGTINSTSYFVIPGSNSGTFISNLRNSSNVNVPGRWAFRVDSESQSNKDNVVEFRVRLSSFSDLTQSGNIEIILQQIKQELFKYGLPNSIKLKLRKLQKIKP
ncbi:hypothetical protein QQF64_005133 [Cirrhinus molitorella]|uniref:NIDO domain-containing protein n=1 Tax=Cirrhinus molitorella TaxID=172907 RepID=A0ABR3MIA0_9TELE